MIYTQPAMTLYRMRSQRERAAPDHVTGERESALQSVAAAVCATSLGKANLAGGKKNKFYLIVVRFFTILCNDNPYVSKKINFNAETSVVQILVSSSSLYVEPK